MADSVKPENSAPLDSSTELLSEDLQDELWDACVKGSLFRVKDVISRGADPHSGYYGMNNDQTALHVACGYGHVNVVRYLVEECQCDAGATTKSGLTSHLIGSLFGHLEVVKYLVQQGNFDISKALGDKYTPLHLSCEEGHLDLLKYLVEELHCEIDLTTKSGMSHFCSCCWRGHINLVRYLVERQKFALQETEVHGFTPLIYCCTSSWPCFSLEVLEYLLKDLKMDPNETSTLGDSPLELVVTSPTFKSDQKQKAIRLLLAYGAKPPCKTWNQYLPSSSPHKPAKAYSKVFIMGNPGGGKSTLAKSLETESRGAGSWLLNHLRKVSDVSIKTAGIVTRDIVSQSLGRMTLYDLAGHSEFYASHDAALRNALAGSPSSIILLVADMREGGKLFEEGILKWCSFAENLYGRSSDFLPFLIIVGSHADSTSKADVCTCQQIVSHVQSATSLSNFSMKGFIPLDCRYSESSGMKQLRSILAKCSELLQQKELLTFREHCFLILLQDKFKDVAAVRIEDVISSISTISDASKSPQAFLPSDSESLAEICSQLNKRGNILFLPNTTHPEKGWVVLQKDVLLRQVNGSLFAPSGFKEYTPMATDTGIIPVSKLASQFPGIDTDLIMSFMCHLQFCLEVKDPEILKQLFISGNHSENEQFLFFPGLVTVEAPKEIWDSSDEFTYQSVWMLQCSKPDQFFPSQFLHITIHRLAFSFVMGPDTSSDTLDQVSIHRICKVWKNGIFWSSLDGVDVLVEISGSNTLKVFIGARPECELHGVGLRSQIISTILKTRTNYCPKVEVSEFFVRNDCISYPLPQEVELIPLQSIAVSVIKCRAFCYSNSNRIVNLSTLLHFEPFADLGEEVIRELFEGGKSELTNRFLANLADRLHTKTGILMEIFDTSLSSLNCELISAPSGETFKLLRVLQLWRNHEPSYFSLCNRLNEYSVFAFRNPLSYIL